MNHDHLLNSELDCVDNTYGIKVILKKIKVDIDFLNQLDQFLLKYENTNINDPIYWSNKSHETLLASKRCYHNIRELIEMYENFDTHNHICNHFRKLKKKLTTEIISASFVGEILDNSLLDARDSLEIFFESKGAKKTKLITNEYKKLTLEINNELLKKIKCSEILLSKLTDIHFFILNITIPKSIKKEAR